MATKTITQLTATTTANDTGEIPIYDSGTKKITRANFLGLPAWTDLLVPLTQGKVGANSKPDFDYTNIGYLFPQNDTSEALYLIVQFPHQYKIGSDTYPHIHWRQTGANAVTWKMDYKWFNIGDAVPANFTTLTSNALAITYTSGSIHQISSFPAITGSGKGISSMLVVKLYRDDNTTTGDVLAFQFDFHYQVDSFGSSQEFIK